MTTTARAPRRPDEVLVLGPRAGEAAAMHTAVLLVATWTGPEKANFGVQLLVAIFTLALAGAAYAQIRVSR
jgi:hypothetical protein